MLPNLPSHNLPVVTRGGRFLGRVVDVEVDPTGREVRCYHVASPLSLTKLWRQRLLITPAQVVSITPQMMIVEDSKLAEAVSVAPGLASEPS